MTRSGLKLIGSTGSVKERSNTPSSKSSLVNDISVGIIKSGATYAAWVALMPFTRGIAGFLSRSSVRESEYVMKVLFLDFAKVLVALRLLRSAAVSVILIMVVGSTNVSVEAVRIYISVALIASCTTISLGIINLIGSSNTRDKLADSKSSPNVTSVGPVKSSINSAGVSESEEKGMTIFPA